MDSCRIDEQIRLSGVPGLCLENEQIRIVVLTGKGTDILEFRHKATDTDVLFKTPWGLKNPQTYVHDTPELSAPFMDFYPGGWQELFPNAGNACHYKGAEFGFHGEICKVPWEHSVLEDSRQRAAVKFWVRTVRAPFLVEKTLSLEAGRPTLVIEETITNEGAEPMDFMWGHHPAFGAPFLDEHCLLFTPAGGVETAHGLPAGQRLKAETRFNTFPQIRTSDDQEFDISRMWPPSARFTHLSYLTGLKEGWYCLVNEQTRLGFALSWDLRIFRYLWLWQEFCGTPHYPWWGQGYVVGIEPHSSIPGLGLQKAIERGTQLNLAPGENLSTRLCASLFAAEQEPKGVTDEGQVVYEEHGAGMAAHEREEVNGVAQSNASVTGGCFIIQPGVSQCENALTFFERSAASAAGASACAGWACPTADTVGICGPRAGLTAGLRQRLEFLAL